MFTLMLESGTFAVHPVNEQAWIITSRYARAYKPDDDILLHAGDVILVDGTVMRGGSVFAKLS